MCCRWHLKHTMPVLIVSWWVHICVNNFSIADSITLINLSSSYNLLTSWLSLTCNQEQSFSEADVALLVNLSPTTWTDYLPVCGENRNERLMVKSWASMLPNVSLPMCNQYCLKICMSSSVKMYEIIWPQAHTTFLVLVRLAVQVEHFSL